MDPEAPYRIAAGGLVTSALGGTYGLLYSIWHSQPWISLAGRAAVNSGIVGWSFFGIREIFVSPLLTSTLPWREYQRRRIALNMKPLPNDSEMNEATFKDFRTSKLLDTFVAGGMTGGILNTIRRGPAVLGPSFLTSGLLCSLLQLGINELSIQRIKHYSQVQAAANLEAAQGYNFRERLEKWQETGRDFWKNLLPRKLSDEEYAERMAAQERLLKERQAAKERALTEKNSQ